MANFATHLAGGSVTGAFGASVLFGTGLFTLEQTVTLWLAAVIGGLLPDLDADVSAPLQWIFTLLGFLAAVFALQGLAGQSLPVIWTGMACGYLAVRYGVLTLFARLTRHRGAWHSCLAAVFAALGVALACWRWTGQAIDFCWALGGMILLGFLTHLLLDECCALNLSGIRVKRSFGSACKPFSVRVWWASLMLAGASVWMWQTLPAPDRVVPALAAVFQHLPNWQLVWLSCR